MPCHTHTKPFTYITLKTSDVHVKVFHSYVCEDFSIVYEWFVNGLPLTHTLMCERTLFIGENPRLPHLPSCPRARRIIIPNKQRRHL